MTMGEWSLMCNKPLYVVTGQECLGFAKLPLVSELQPRPVIGSRCHNLLCVSCGWCGQDPLLYYILHVCCSSGGADWNNSLLCFFSGLLWYLHLWWSPAPGLAACLSGDQAGLSISSPTSKGPPVSWWTMKGAGLRWSESLYPKVWLKRE